MDIKQLLKLSIERGASDVHLVVNHYPAFRIDGTLYQIRSLPVISKEDAERLLLALLSPLQLENFKANLEIDFGYELEGQRFRVNVYQARGFINASLRLVPNKIKTIEELDMPPMLHDIAKLNSGLVLLTGPTGEGKSTTIASIINEINLQQAKHIITIEDPVEFVFEAGRSVISQRELHQDTHSWEMALRSVLREDPDIVLVGEMRDYESVSHVLTIAETGHLVFSTLHTISAPEAINRIIDVFPSHQQNQIVAQLSSVLRTVITQRLLPRADNKGRIAAVEILHNNNAVSNIIRERKPHLLDNILQTSESEGFVLFEKYLKKLHDSGKITKETALNYSIRPRELLKLIS